MRKGRDEREKDKLETEGDEKDEVWKYLEALYNLNYIVIRHRIEEILIRKAPQS